MPSIRQNRRTWGAVEVGKAAASPRADDSHGRTFGHVHIRIGDEHLLSRLQQRMVSRRAGTIIAISPASSEAGTEPRVSSGAAVGGRVTGRSHELRPLTGAWYVSRAWFPCSQAFRRP